MDLVSVIVGPSEDSEETSPTECPRRPARKHRWLSIQEKVELLRKLDLSVPVQEICKLYGIGSSTVYDLRKQRNQILEFHANSECSKLMRLRKTMRNSRSAEHDKAMVDWYRKQRASGVYVTGSRIVERAREVHQELKLSHDCAYSEGWLQRFKKRHGIVMTKMAKTDVEQDSKIVSAVEPHKCLYDVGLPDYKDGLLKDNIWKDIANTLGLPADIVKARWHNLLSDYQKSVWSVNKIQVFNKMAFLKPHLIRDGGDQPVASTEKSSFSVKSEVLSSDEEYADTIDINPSDMGQANMSLADAYKRSRFPLVTYEDHDDKADNEELDMKVEEEDSLLPDDPNNSASVSSFQIPPLESSCTINKSVGPVSHKKKAEKKKLTSDISGVDPDLEYFKGFLSLVKELSSKRKRQLFATFAQELFRHLDEQEKEETDSTDI